jgi:outer membrane protein TolC
LVTPARADTTAPPAPDSIAPPPVDDPMLAPPPRAPRAIASWDDALALIRAQSPDYLGSAQAVARAEAQREVALSTVLPSLGAQGTYTHEFLSPLSVTLEGPDPRNKGMLIPVPIVSPPADAFTASATASWAIINPRGINGIGIADKNIDVAKLSFEDRRRQIATAVVDAMLSTLAAARVADLNRVGLRTALERLVLTQTRLQYGQGTELDVDRALQDVASARATLISGDESLRRSREALGASLGSPVPMAPEPTVDLAAFEAAVARTCHLNEDMERRPDVTAARRRVEAAERTVRDAELLFVPSAGVSSTLSYGNQPVLAPNTTWSLAAVVNVPIYDGGARYGALRDSRAALEQARQTLVTTRLDAVVASAQAQRAVSVLTQSRDVAQQQRDLAARIDQRTRDGYARGLGTSLDLVISAQALRQADIDLAILDFQVDDARANAVLVNAECVY